MSLLTVKDLSFSYSQEENVLNGVSFVVEKGTYISLIGHNGSGKSTIAKLLAGLLEAKSGTIKAFDLEYNRKNIRKIRSRIGIVFQNPDNQFICASVKDDIAFGLENRQVDPAKMNEIILEYARKVNMEDFLDKEPENLSGGQKQRVAIAGVLAMKPDILILDESTAMLDPKGKKEINDVIKNLRTENKDLTIISITHDIEEAFESDRIIVLNNGKIALDGDKELILSHKQEIIDMGLDIPFKNKFIDALKDAQLDDVIKELYD